MFCSYDERNKKVNKIKSFIGEKEIWAFYLKSNFYVISNMGRIKNIVTGKILKQTITSQNYRSCRITLSNGDKVTKGVHRFVAETFIPIKNKHLYEVNHIDGDKTNNKLNNLEWVTRKENLQHARDNNLFKKQYGEKNGNCNYSDEIVKKIVDFKNKGLTCKEISVKMNLKLRTVYHLLNRRKHV